MTGTSYLTNLINEDFTLANVKDKGYTVYYDADNSINSWLDSEIYTLIDGGKLTLNLRFGVTSGQSNSYRVMGTLFRNLEA